MALFLAKVQLRSQQDPATQQTRLASQAARVLFAATMGTAVAVGTSFYTPWQSTLLFFWVTTGLAWVIPMWATVLPLGEEEAARFATREDPHGPAGDTLLLSASVAALGAVILGIIKAAGAHGSEKTVLLAAGISAIIVSWSVVHTVFSLRYAGIYYTGPDGGVNFNEDEKPVYADFAYMAFTIGMTYQVSDTAVTSKKMRHTVVKHALLSYLLGTVIIAATINLAAGLVK